MSFVRLQMWGNEDGPVFKTEDGIRYEGPVFGETYDGPDDREAEGRELRALACLDAVEADLSDRVTAQSPLWNRFQALRREYGVERS